MLGVSYECRNMLDVRISNACFITVRAEWSTSCVCPVGGGLIEHIQVEVVQFEVGEVTGTGALLL
jgi:hypothetical protein